MPRPEKVQAVEEIRSRIEAAQATFLTEYRGLNVAQQQQLRRNLRASGTEYKIVKMTLAASPLPSWGSRMPRNGLPVPRLWRTPATTLRRPPRRCATSLGKTKRSWSRPDSSAGAFCSPSR